MLKGAVVQITNLWQQRLEAFSGNPKAWEE